MRLHRLAVPAAATVLVTAGLAVPASAGPAPAVPHVGVLVPGQVTVVEGNTKSVTATVLNAGGAEAKAVVLQFGSALHPLDASAGLGLPAGCDAQGCVVGDLAPGATRRYTFTLTPTGTDLTSTFDVTVGGAEGVLGYESPVTVVRSTGGDLEPASIDDLELSRGQSAGVPVVIRNAGGAQVDGFALVLVAEAGLEALTGYRNCQAKTDELLSTVVCRFDQKFPPGATLALPSGTPLRIRVAADAGGPYRYSVGLAAVGWDRTAAPASKSGPILRLVPAEALPEAEDGIAGFSVAVGPSSADSAALGGSFSGAVGDTATVQVGVHNLGPSAVLPPGVAWLQTVEVTLPANVRPTAIDDDCIAGTGPDGFDFENAGTADGNLYTCFVLTRLGTGARHVFTFTGEITATSGKSGSVAVDGGVQDTGAANDKAILDVRLTAGGAGGGLPVTGAPAGWVTAGGAVLLIIGLLALRMARRRRIVTVTD